ncbi:MAG: threonine--tRNA ligase [Candidatus Hydrothermota bacterium]|nr:MAG: threonine--tRNA ligase [Candidatus Hydrothermae bacterium]
MKIETVRHSLSHIMATAVQELYPGTKFGIGPAIEDGFYYDFDLPASISPEDLPKIEKRMKELIMKDIKFEREKVSKKKAEQIFKDQPYKLELIKEMEEEITVYRSGDFVDLCKGPHVESTKQINPRAFKLTKVAGAYWRGDEKNPMLVRIYGVAFETEKELKQYLERKEEAEKRDHRKLGKKLELFLIDEEFGKGLILWSPRGAILRKAVMDFALETYLERGYQLVSTPHIARLDLWKRSGHWDFYRESMYSPMEVDEEKFVVKPMNCPGHVKIYNSKIRSYRDLPLRFTEMGTVYRYEKSGVLHGLTRVRGFTQDDAHIFCTQDQLESELKETIDLTKYILETFGFKDFKVSLSLRNPEKKEKYLGDDKTWDVAEKALKAALKKKNLDYVSQIGEAAFYGPKIDVLVEDAIGREWQLSTIQVDFNFPEKFKMEYVDKKGKKQRPIMIHRALLGSLERFIGILIEHYAGAFPLWLAPVQISVIPVGSRHREYAIRVSKELKANGLRVEVRDEAETVSKKIREGEIQKIPYILVVGDQEEKVNSVRVRFRGEGDIGLMALDKFLERAKAEIKERK